MSTLRHVQVIVWWGLEWQILEVRGRGEIGGNQNAPISELNMWQSTPYPPIANIIREECKYQGKTMSNNSTPLYHQLKLEIVNILDIKELDIKHIAYKICRYITY